ncbi:hypothetical protein L829_1753 [Mycobacteroides abscessus MAB_030201_1075]|uniref:Uncharacterized protein n=1 Tax=Mycobacteroides abscessus MAB_030201_1075 TaxID=1335410 RepID=A0A829PLX6_9MYCO|nr:hypothetical protein L835_3748 [Mycobacteroides abscessus MAB_110811_1470]ETZ88196.1 hypothetical protein L829_1753 [Mycobacteroides abscessus MAB_030201_1075]ETZ93394.1 hypothetical protein L828_3833 [Mycobacteroides abscessus MAB_030201_1061]
MDVLFIGGSIKALVQREQLAFRNAQAFLGEHDVANFWTVVYREFNGHDSFLHVEPGSKQPILLCVTKSPRELNWNIIMRTTH